MKRTVIPGHLFAILVPIRSYKRQSTVAHGLRWLLLWTICQHSAVDLAAQKMDLSYFDQKVQQEAQGYQWLSWSTSAIGHRLTGSPQGALAEHTADSLFRLCGLETVSLFPFSAQAWGRDRVSLEMNDGEGVLHLSAVSLANTPLDVAIEAPVVDIGNGLETDIEAVNGTLQGKIVLVNLGLVNAIEGAKNLHRSEKVSLAMQQGAAGVIFVNQVEGHILLTGTASIDGNLIPIPAACIATEDGILLREQLALGKTYTAKLSMKNTSAMVTANNVIAEIKGTLHPEEVIIVGGHLDCWDLATGATDNGLGSYSILDLARAMQSMPFKPERTVRFVLFMGEEQGLLGSRALVKHYQETGELDKITCMINLDMSGHPQGFGVAGPEGWHAAIADLLPAMHAMDSTAFEGRVSEEVWLHSDHQPFLMAGVPVLYPLSDLGKHVYGCYHSSCDDIHLVDPQAMVNNVRFTGALVYGLAATKELPAHFTKDQLRQRLIEAELETPLRLGGDWPF
ncbi:MAG: M20/M25/M40 family metallo-hydrolase [Flavobacteriales bacterium]|nr:M20/M25/M40 family metallo-hydrolase [Flavobacteriales bacterium]MBK6944323.1 M20/M25/M40 family metallo-hydrolase [Flavobacteriales bacterium]MBP9139947.1 M20/M25/M40 family metallo-hydrolase [Flavobacteriales bacterium]HQV53486.1 M20/M25/M40 family metallo-hydrolase [Flavobacteriales bacterium]HQX31236.1 M20/M25/M40 family metallo-hydrolase [Flavobacteriales bacterium]